MTQVSKSYCRVPFDSVTITNTGRMQLCCEAQWTELLQTEKTKLTEIKSIDEWFQSDYLNNVRKLMLQGKKLKECESCYKNEKLYNTSPRIGINNKYFKNNNDLQEKSIKKIDLKLGNKCNLKCKMCFPYASSELWKEWKDLGWNSTEKDPNSKTSWRYYDGYFEEDYAWPKNKSNMDKIKEAAIKSKLIHVTGGEPTINPEFFDLLKYCIQNNVAKDIKLEVTTNATKIHPKFFDMVKEFKNIVLTISMDGTGKTYEYVRYPANYNVVHKNILRYNEFIKTLNNNSCLRFNFVFQLWNVHNAIDVIKTLSPLAVNHDESPVMFDMLNDPQFMHWSMLPESYIKQVIKDLSVEMKTDHPQIIRWGLIKLVGILKAYKQMDNTKIDDLKKQLVEFTTVQDKHRNIKLENYIPQLVSPLSI